MTISTLISNIKEDVRLLFAVRSGKLQLKAIEKGVPAAVKSVYVSIILIFVLILLPILTVTGALAFALIFASTGDAYATVRSLTLGFCCIDGVLLLVIALLIIVMKPLTTAVEAKITNDLLDKIEANEREEVTRERMDNIRNNADETSEPTATEVLRVSRDERTYKDR